MALIAGHFFVNEGKRLMMPLMLDGYLMERY